MSYQMPIELGKVREFSRAVKTRNQAHRGPNPVIPPTWLTSARTLWEPSSESAMAQLGFDIRRVLHGEEEYIFHGPPPRAGQVLTCQARVAETFEKPGKRGGTMRFGKLITEFRDESGRLIAEQHSLIIETEKAPKKDEA